MVKVISSLDIPNDIKYIVWLSNALYIFFALLLFSGAVQFYIKNKNNNLNSIIVRGDVMHNDITTIRNQIITSITGNFYNIDLIQAKQTFETIPWVNHAIVKRVYPNQIEAKLSEFKPRAIWGSREDLKLIDDAGVIFETNADDDEYDQLPQFIGPEGQGKVMLDMFKELATVINLLQNKIEILELNARGSWIATLQGGARMELGRGNIVDVMERVKKFSQGTEQVLSKMNKKLMDIQYIDLRHSEGYAMRVQGVSTLELKDTLTSVKK